METEDGWVGLGAVGHRLANIASDFDPRTYGYRKLSDLVRKTGAFDVDQAEGRAMRIRAKPKPASKTRAKATAPGEVEVSQHRIAVRSTSTEVTSRGPSVAPPTTPRMENVSSVSTAQGPKVRRLSAGEDWIRNFSSALPLVVSRVSELRDPGRAAGRIGVRFASPQEGADSNSG